MQDSERKRLSAGRERANYLKRQAAEVKLAKLERAVDDLYKNGKGFEMGYPEMATFLIERGHEYAKSTLVGKIKRVAPASKKKHSRK